MTVAVAEIYTRQGLYEEAMKIYQRIIHAEPDNFEAKKKLADVENLIKAKGGSKSAAPAPAAAPAAVISTPKPASEAGSTVENPPEGENSGGKKKSNRVGYV